MINSDILNLEDFNLIFEDAECDVDMRMSNVVNQQ